MARGRNRFRWTAVHASWVLVLALAGSELRCRSAARGGAQRVVVIGLDGADWAVIDRLIAAGDLPHLARLKREGTWARLRSMEPMLSPILWTTMATGKSADKHGITWFMVDNPKTGGRMPITSNIRRVKAFWNILSERHIKTAVVGWWATWPAEPIDGYIVSDFTGIHGFNVSGQGVDTDLGRMHPPDLAGHLPKVVRAEDVPYETVARLVDISREEYAPIAKAPFDFKVPLHHLRNILATRATYVAMADALLHGRSGAEGLAPPQVVALYLEGIDSASHLFMQFAPPRMAHVGDADWTRYRNVVNRYYRDQDEAIGLLLAGLDPAPAVLIVSDHGFKTGAARPVPDGAIDVPNAHEWHQPDGILIAHGPPFRAGEELAQASIKDLTPTLLHLLGLPRADDMDGAVLTDLFTTEFLREHPVASLATYEDGGARGGGDDALSAAVSEGVEERLRALGYIGSSDDSSAEVHGNRGNIELHRGDVLAAAEAFRKAVEMDPLNPQGHVGLAFIYAQQGRPADAIRSLEYALKLSPGAHQIEVELADLHFDGGNYDRADELYQAVIAARPDDAAALVGAGSVQRMRGDLAGARARFERARTAEPQSFVPLYNLGVLSQAEGDLEAARKWYDQAAALAPQEAVVHNNLGGLYEKLGDVEGAIAAYRRARDADPRHFESRYNLGTMLLRNGDLHDAERALKEALAISPDVPFAHNNLALVYLRLGWYDKALRQYRVLIRLTPGLAEPYYQASRLVAASGDRAEAGQLLARAIERGGEPVRRAALGEPVFRKAHISPPPVPSAP